MACRSTVQSHRTTVGTIFHISLQDTYDTAGVDGFGLALENDVTLVLAALDICRRSTYDAAEAHLRTTGSNHVRLNGKVCFIAAVFNQYTLTCAVCEISRIGAGIAEYTTDSTVRSVTTTLFHSSTAGKSGINYEFSIIVAVGCAKGNITCYAADAGIGSGDILTSKVGNLSIVLGRLKLSFNYTDHTAECRITARTSGRITPLNVSTVDAVLDDSMIPVGIFDRRSLANHTADTELLHCFARTAEKELNGASILAVLDNCFS